jgi:hypothetical protein
MRKRSPIESCASLLELLEPCPRSYFAAYNLSLLVQFQPDLVTLTTIVKKHVSKPKGYDIKNEKAEKYDLDRLERFKNYLSMNLSARTPSINFEVRRSGAQNSTRLPSALASHDRDDLQPQVLPFDR